jgi:hypothetical protein
MKRSILRLLSLALFIFPLQCFSASEPVKAGEMLPVAPAIKEIVKMTENGFEPSSITLRKLDSSVFFLNSTRDSLVTIQVPFGERKSHCASPNLDIGKDGVIRSKKPIGPRDFALICFPEPGTYKVMAQGVRGGTKEIVGTVNVQD